MNIDNLLNELDKAAAALNAGEALEFQNNIMTPKFGGSPMFGLIKSKGKFSLYFNSWTFKPKAVCDHTILIGSVLYPNEPPTCENCGASVGRDGKEIKAGKVKS